MYGLNTLRNVSEEKNQGLSEEVILHFFGAAVGAVEWWFRNVRLWNRNDFTRVKKTSKVNNIDDTIDHNKSCFKERDVLNVTVN